MQRRGDQRVVAVTARRHGLSCRTKEGRWQTGSRSRSPSCSTAGRRTCRTREYNRFGIVAPGIAGGPPVADRECFRPDGGRRRAGHRCDSRSTQQLAGPRRRSCRHRSRVTNVSTNPHRGRQAACRHGSVVARRLPRLHRRSLESMYPIGPALVGVLHRRIEPVDLIPELVRLVECEVPGMLWETAASPTSIDDVVDLVQDPRSSIGSPPGS